MTLSFAQGLLGVLTERWEPLPARVLLWILGGGLREDARRPHCRAPSSRLDASSSLWSLEKAQSEVERRTRLQIWILIPHRRRRGWIGRTRKADFSFGTQETTAAIRSLFSSLTPLAKSIASCPGLQRLQLESRKLYSLTISRTLSAFFSGDRDSFDAEYLSQFLLSPPWR